MWNLAKTKEAQCCQQHAETPPPISGRLKCLGGRAVQMGQRALCTVIDSAARASGTRGPARSRPARSCSCTAPIADVERQKQEEDSGGVCTCKNV